MRPTSINKLAASPQCPCGRVGTESRNKQVTFLSWGTGRFRPLGDWMEGSMEKFLSSSHLEATTTTTVSRQGCKKKKKKKNDSFHVRRLQNANILRIGLTQSTQSMHHHLTTLPFRALASEKALLRPSYMEPIHSTPRQTSCLIPAKTRTRIQQQRKIEKGPGPRPEKRSEREQQSGRSNKTKGHRGPSRDGERASRGPRPIRARKPSSIVEFPRGHFSPQPSI
ncbi:hypothetical protein IWX92DRAFT_82228 [Phyllosticta citricarpa]